MTASASISTSISGATSTCLTRRVGRPTLNHMVKYEGNALDATFAALADPTRRAILARLAGREAPVSEVDLRPGGRYRIHMQAPDGAVTHRLVGVYRLVDPPKKLVYTWRWENEPESGETLVTVEFLDRGASTELVLTHELFPNDEASRKHEAGWTACFDKLARVVQVR